MWRIYSSVHQDGSALDAAFDAGEAVRLRTTVQKLLNCVAAGVGRERSSGCFVARVKYFDENGLTQEVANIIRSFREQAFSGASGQADARLFKRDAFAHENEVRLLYVDVARQFDTRDQVEVPIDPNFFIEEITFDPRIRGGNQEAWRTNWIRERRFNNEVNRSLLYLGAALIVPLFTQEELAKL
jgi:hypothetical protein